MLTPVVRYPAMSKYIFTRLGLPVALVLIVGLPESGHGEDFSYRFVEVTADVSRTKNTADAPLEDDARGRYVGVGGSWEVFDSLYFKGAWSRETKTFRNEVERTPLDLNSEQTDIVLGAGYHFNVGERTSVYAEALALVHFEVEHLIPVVVPSQSGPPTVSTSDSVIDGNGFRTAIGMRHWIAQRVELESQISLTHTRADILRTGRDISDSETMFRLIGHIHSGFGFSVGPFFSFSKHTDNNFDNIRKLGVVLRYHF